MAIFLDCLGGYGLLMNYIVRFSFINTQKITNNGNQLIFLKLFSIFFGEVEKFQVKLRKVPHISRGSLTMRQSGFRIFNVIFFLWGSGGLTNYLLSGLGKFQMVYIFGELI